MQWIYAASRVAPLRYSSFMVHCTVLPLKLAVKHTSKCSFVPCRDFPSVQWSRRLAISCMCCVAISTKSNLKKHIMAIRIKIWRKKKILHCSIHGRNAFLHVLWHHDWKKVNYQEALCHDPNWRKAFKCHLCGIMAITNNKLKKHTSLHFAELAKGKFQ